MEDIKVVTKTLTGLPEKRKRPKNHIPDQMRHSQLQILLENEMITETFLSFPSHFCTFLLIVAYYSVMDVSWAVS